MKRAFGVVVLACSLAACAPVSIVNPHLVSFTAPAQYATVHLPVTLRWQLGAGRVMLFIDRPPMAPGEIFQGQNAADLSGVVTTSATSYTLTSLPAATEGSRGRHEVIIVRVDSSGHRVGDDSDYLELQVDH